MQEEVVGSVDYEDNDNDCTDIHKNLTNLAQIQNNGISMKTEFTIPSTKILLNITWCTFWIV